MRKFFKKPSFKSIIFVIFRGWSSFYGYIYDLGQYFTTSGFLSHLLTVKFKAPLKYMTEPAQYFYMT